MVFKLEANIYTSHHSGGFLLTLTSFLLVFSPMNSTKPLRDFPDSMCCSSLKAHLHQESPAKHINPYETETELNCIPNFPSVAPSQAAHTHTSFKNENEPETSHLAF